MKKLMSLLVLAVSALVFATVSAQGLQVAEAKLGKGVQDRTITEEATTFAVNDKVYIWLKITGSGSDSVKVNWKVGDNTSTVTLPVGGDPWRTWANKTAWKAGEWTVTVTDASDLVLKELKFTVQ
jgi:hypothetical protein